MIASPSCWRARAVADTLKLLDDELAPQRRVVHAGDVVYEAGEHFGNLYILNSGFFKMVNLTPTAASRWSA